MTVKNHKFYCIALFFLFSICAFGQDFENGIAPFALITRQSNVREQASKTSANLQSLDTDSVIRVIDKTRKNGYLRVLFGNGEQGYVYYKNVKIPERVEKTKKFALFSVKEKVCEFTYVNCPLSGCAEADDREKALFNIAKRGSNIIVRNPLLIDFTDLKAMQKEIGERLKLRSGNFELNRNVLKNVRVKNGVVSESSLVKIIGFIPLTDRDKGLKTGASESVNCNSTKTIEKDIHIPLAPNKNSTEFQGIIIEMIPQGRSPNWNLTKLRKIQDERRMVMVIGGLFYDNEHFVNSNPVDVLRNQPKRFSLWEVHPVKEFYVCKKLNNSCSPANFAEWTPLDSYN